MLLPLVSSTANFGNENLNLINKVLLKYADMTMDVNHVFNRALR